MFKSTLSAPREFFVRMVRSGKVIYLTIKAVSLKRAKQKFIRQNVRQLPHIKWEIQDEPFRHIVDEYVPQNDEFLEDTVEWFLRAQIERIEKMKKRNEMELIPEKCLNEIKYVSERNAMESEQQKNAERLEEEIKGWERAEIENMIQFEKDFDEFVDKYIDKVQELPEDFHICERCGWEDCNGWKCVGVESKDEFAHLEWI